MGRKPKICINITRLIRGGAAAVALSQAAGLSSAGYEVTIACGPQDPEGATLIPDAENAGLPVKVFPDLLRDLTPKCDMKIIPKLAAFFRSGGFDIVHTHTSKAGIMGRWAARFAGVPVLVHSPHGHIYSKGGNIPGVWNHPARRRFYWHLEKLTNAITDAVVTLTERERSEQVALGLGPKNKFCTVHNGIDAGKYECTFENRARMRGEFGYSDNDFVCVMMGRVTSEKGHSVMLAAAEILMSAASNVKFLIAGEGPLLSELKSDAESRMLKSVRFIGFRSDVPDVLSAADALILPSLYEGLGLSALEAMAAGLPVIGSRIGGVPEVVLDGETGILFTSGDGAGLARGIERIMRDRAAARRMGEKGRVRVAAMFTTERMVLKLDGLYRNLMKRKGLL
jgi:glycosyltransferase involved in cell wall biosynthesis